MKNQTHINYIQIFTLLTKYWYLWLTLISFIIIKLIIKSNSFKGWLGELNVRLMHWIHLNKKKYHTFNDVYFGKSDGGSIQIDHIIVSEYGIFITETKNIQGSIKGKEYNDEWYQILNNQEEPFRSPLRQNEYHIKFISKFLNITDNKFHSIIMFTADNCKFINKMPENVLNKDYIKYIKSKTEKILTEKEVTNTIEWIRAYRKRNNYKTRKEHIQYVKNIKENYPQT